MKKLVLGALVAFLFIVGSVDAGTWTKCNWLWSTAVTGANDPPDSVYCRDANKSYASKGATYIQPTLGADAISVTWNTNSPTYNGVTICANVSTDSDINVLVSNDDGVTFDTGTGTAAYHQEDDLGNDLVTSFELTPPSGGYFKLTADGDTDNFCVAVQTTVYWE